LSPGLMDSPVCRQHLSAYREDIGALSHRCSEIGGVEEDVDMMDQFRKKNLKTEATRDPKDWWYAGIYREISTS
jgi:hypothetical protein